MSAPQRARAGVAWREPVLARHLLAALTVSLAGCAQPTVGLVDLTERPGEKALLAGWRSYDDGQYPQAEVQLNTALTAGLASPRDRAAAHKYLAFIACTSDRAAQCEAEFRRARAADPAFVLTRSEAGHPVWGPVYKRIVP
ncbi:MAG TPA: TssQ family T6SS-associated lipoprotein [Caldimonas sp.]|nr:TssQ family T6SS-associated lipoprotein [Caldimonas sp.]